MRTFLVAAVGLVVSVAAFAENSILALPGQAEGTAVGAAETNAARTTHASLRVSAELTGRFRNCTFENCQLVGPEKRFTDCTLGAGCTRAAK